MADENIPTPPKPGFFAKRSHVVFVIAAVALYIAINVLVFMTRGGSSIGNTLQSLTRTLTAGVKLSLPDRLSLLPAGQPSQLPDPVATVTIPISFTGKKSFAVSIPPGTKGPVIDRVMLDTTGTTGPTDQKSSKKKDKPNADLTTIRARVGDEKPIASVLFRPDKTNTKGSSSMKLVKGKNTDGFWETLVDDALVKDGKTASIVASGESGITVIAIRFTKAQP